MQTHAMFKGDAGKRLNGINGAVGVVAGGCDDRGGIFTDMCFDKVTIDLRGDGINRGGNDFQPEQVSGLKNAGWAVSGQMISGSVTPRSILACSR